MLFRSVLFGVLLLDEAPSWRIVFGGIVTVTGVAMIVFRPKTRTIARANTQPEP